MLLPHPSKIGFHHISQSMQSRAVSLIQTASRKPVAGVMQQAKIKFSRNRLPVQKLIPVLGQDWSTRA